MREINIKATKVFLDTWNAIQSGKYKMICQEGSSRSSKTWSDFQCVFKYAYERRNKVINILRDTAIDCRDILEPEWVKWLSDPCGRTKEFEEGLITAAQYTQLLKKEDLRPLFTENKTKHVWTMKHTGTTIRFTGLDDEDKVMGMTQDLCWINEPYNFQHEVYKQLSQRTADLLLVDWNPKKKHWIDIEKAKETSIVLKSTFRDNAFIPEKAKQQILSYQPLSLCNVVVNGKISEQDVVAYDVIKNSLRFTKYEIEELARCRKNEHERSASKYHWEVFGLGLHSELPNRIYKWEPISLSDYYAIDVTKYYYSDWGSVDPWAIGEVKYYDGALYVRELNYASENQLRASMSATELQQIAGADEGIVSWLFRKLGIDQNADIICDTNRPNKILALRAAGWDYAVGLVKKETGATKSGKIDGIDLLNNLRVYYTSDSENIEFEQETYSRKLDTNGVVTDEPEDGNDHHCFTGETLINTRQGDKFIKDIEAGDFVLTSNGYRQVLKKWDNGLKQTFNYCLRFDTFIVNLQCTPEHLVKTDNGWIQISQLQSGQTVYLNKYSLEKYIGCTQKKDIFQEEINECTSLYGSITTVKNKKDFMFTTSMVTPGIIILKTSNLKKVINILANTVKEERRRILNGLKNFTQQALPLLKAGTNPPTVSNGINNMLLNIHSENSPTEKANAKIAVTNTLREVKANDSAITTARLVRIDAKESSAQQVYDLTVSECNEYFANGVLVHNCDGIRYVALFLQAAGIIAKV